jgi:elongation factor G
MLIRENDCCTAGLSTYYETITRAADATFTHKKIIGGGGEFAVVSLRLEPLPGGSGLQFINDVTDEVLPAKLVEGVREGVQETSKRGVFAGHPVTDLRVTLIDGKYHDIDSDRRTFSLAASGAFLDGMRKAGPKIREP